MGKHIFIVIVTHNNLSEIKEHLPALLSQNDVNARVVIVDNGSTDGTQHYLKENYKRVFFIENKANLGMVKALNIGIKFALANRATHVVLFAIALKIMEGDIGKLTNRRSDVVGAVIAHYSHGDISYEIGTTVSRILGQPAMVVRSLKPPKSFNASPKFVSFRCVAIAANVIDKVGVLDERFTMYFANLDYCQRVRKAGFKLSIEPQIVVVLPTEKLMKITKSQQRIYRRDYRYYVAKYSRFGGRVGAYLLSIFPWIKGMITTKMIVQQVQGAV